MTNQPPPPRPIAEDLTAATFSGQSISLFDLFRESLRTTGRPMISGKTFTDCTIEGPAVMLALKNVVFDACDMGYTGNGDVRALLLMPMAKNRVIGAIAIEDCRFERCNFFMIGFTGPDSFIDQFLSVLDKPKSPVS